MATNSKNHCDDFGQKRRFCYVDITKKAIFTRLSSIYAKVRVFKKRLILKICHYKAIFSSRMIIRDYFPEVSDSDQPEITKNTEEKE
jgi:hypothetical protein